MPRFLKLVALACALGVASVAAQAQPFDHGRRRVIIMHHDHHFYHHHDRVVVIRR